MTTTTTETIFSRERLAELCRRLETEQQRLLDLYQGTVERGEQIPIGDVDDLVDRAERSWEKEEIFAEREADRERLLLVEDALDRLAAGSYGFCAQCGKVIDYQRLLAVPATPYCTEHQEEAERNRVVERRPYT